MINKEYAKYFKSILCLNGNLPKKSFFKSYESLPIIAADGAANYLYNLGLRPSYIVGDLDSFKVESHNCSDVEIVQYKNQNYCDFEKSLLVIKKNNLFPTLVVGVFGGEADHVINNLNCLVKYSNKCSMVFYDESNLRKPKWGTPTSSSLAFNTQKGAVISIFPYPRAVISSKGLVWELQNQELLQNVKSSIRNRANSLRVDIKIHSGKVIIIMENYILPLL